MIQISSTESSPNELSLNGHIRSRKIAPIDPQTLAAWWMISPDHAKRTVVMTTQRGVQTCLNPNLSRRFPTNDRMLCYKRLPHTVFTDTMFAATPSKRGNKMAQVYVGGRRSGRSRCRICPLTHVRVDRAYQAESVGSNFYLVLLFAIRRSPIL